MKGRVAKFNAKRGFGFIQSPQLDDEIFVHITKVEGRRALRPGQEVTFDTEQTDKGLAAVNVVLKGGGTDKSKASGKAAGLSPVLLFGGIAVLLVIILVLIFL